MAKKPPVMPEACPEPDMSWRAESDARTLHDAEKIRTDKERMKHVKKHVAGLTKIVAPKKPAQKQMPGLTKRK